MQAAPLLILLADDDEGDRLVFKEAFGELNMNCVVHTVSSSKQLMDYLTTKDAALPHFIFLDVSMPRESGLQCLEEIRSHEKFKTVPVSMYSTSAYNNEMKEAFRLGANLYIKKPSDFSVLKKLLATAVAAAPGFREKPLSMEEFLLKV